MDEPDAAAIAEQLKQANTEHLVKLYIKLRDAVAEKEREIKERKQKQDKIAEELLVRCETAGGNITVTGVGRVTRKTLKSYWTSNWPALYKIIKDKDAFHLLHQRITNTAMEQFLEDNPDIMPEGLNLDSKQTVVITRAS